MAEGLELGTFEVFNVHYPVVVKTTQRSSFDDVLGGSSLSPGSKFEIVVGKFT